MVVVGRERPGEPIAAALAGVGADATDAASLPVLAVPLWTLAPAERQSISLPFSPAG